MSATFATERPSRFCSARELMRCGRTLDAAQCDRRRGARACFARCRVRLQLRGAIANLRRDYSSVQSPPRARRSRFVWYLTSAWLELANAYARLDQCVAAADTYREVLAREPAWPDAHFNLGLMQKRLGDRMAAARSFHAAWSRDPMLFDAAGYCVATIAECVREGDRVAPQAPMAGGNLEPVSVSVVISPDRRRQA